jgi:hypothetical protein
MKHQPPPDDPAWEHIRARYEAGEEKVKAIAEEIGMNLQQLTTRAKALGWKLRKAAQIAKRAAKKNVKRAVKSVEAATRPETTQATLLRLKEMLRQRVAHLEAEVRDIGEEVNALANDRQIKDVELRRKLEAELSGLLMTHMGKALEQEAQVVLAEVKSEHWLTRSWRPILMLTLLGFVVFVGLVLPLADGLAGRTLAFNPRWNDIPPQMWDFLMIGMGGYIGGRSLEKIAAQVLAPKAKR